MQKQVENICTYIDAHRDDMFALWTDFVNTPSQAREPVAANAMCEKLEDSLKKIGFVCKTYEVGPVNARALVGVWGVDRPGKPIIFSGHYDTVSLPGEYPFCIDERGHARGLACLDMKGGIIIAMYVVKSAAKLRMGRASSKVYVPWR